MATYCYQCWFHTLNKIIPLVIETCTQKRKNYTTELRFILKLLIALSHLICVVNNTNQMIHLLNNLWIKEISLHWFSLFSFRRNRFPFKQYLFRCHHRRPLPRRRHHHRKRNNFHYAFALGLFVTPSC